MSEKWQVNTLGLGTGYKNAVPCGNGRQDSVVFTKESFYDPNSSTFPLMLGFVTTTDKKIRLYRFTIREFNLHKESSAVAIKNHWNHINSRESNMQSPKPILHGWSVTVRNTKHKRASLPSTFYSAPAKQNQLPRWKAGFWF